MQISNNYFRNNKTIIKYDVICRYLIIVLQKKLINNYENTIIFDCTASVIIHLCTKLESCRKYRNQFIQQLYWDYR
ncbi:protein of unknown function [Chryseobacterium sp. JV274]|nr:protein of unknown function [Chryseobacterium sp. JV274]